MLGWSAAHYDQKVSQNVLLLFDKREIHCTLGMRVYTCRNSGINVADEEDSSTQAFVAASAFRIESGVGISNACTIV